MKYMTYLLSFALLVAIVEAPLARAGEPVGEIGPINPTMFKCVDDDGEEIELDTINDVIKNDPTTEESSCLANFDVISDFGFDPTDGEQLRGFLERAENECEDKGGDLVPIRDTRIDGIVYEFHPTNAADPSGSDWLGVPSRDVPVVARGIGFEIEWGSEKDGTFIFQNLGAGPIVLNLRLPFDAHPINPDLVVKSTGREETLTVFLGFYRGDFPLPTPNQLRIQDSGGTIPFAAPEDIVLAHQCGLPMPNVGGTLPPKQPFSIMALAAIILIILPAAGLLKLRQQRALPPKTE